MIEIYCYLNEPVFPGKKYILLHISFTGFKTCVPDSCTQYILINKYSKWTPKKTLFDVMCKWFWAGNAQRVWFTSAKNLENGQNHLFEGKYKNFYLYSLICKQTQIQSIGERFVRFADNRN